MSAKSDVARNLEAVEIAEQALSWFSKNPSIAAMRIGLEPIIGHDFGERVNHIWYTESLEGEGIKFGYLVMRPGQSRPMNAALCDFQTLDGNIKWVLCAAANHPALETERLAPHLHMPSIVHEATHYLDFTRSQHKPKPYDSADIIDLNRRYYNLPHEFNAFFQQGLYSFLRDLDLVRLRMNACERLPRASWFLYLLRSDAYWPIQFVNGLGNKYRRKYIRRCFRIFSALLC